MNDSNPFIGTWEDGDDYVIEQFIFTEDFEVPLIAIPAVRAPNSSRSSTLKAMQIKRQLMPHGVQCKGKLSEHEFFSELLKQGFEVYVPLVDDNDWAIYIRKNREAIAHCILSLKRWNEFRRVILQLDINSLNQYSKCHVCYISNQSGRPQCRFYRNAKKHLSPE